MAVSGFGLEVTSYWTEENVTAQFRHLVLASGLLLDPAHS